MSQRHSWGNLGIGIAAACFIVGAAVLILVFGRVGTLHGRTFTLYVTTDAARGLIRGSEVWLDGQRVGLVKNVVFRPPSVSEKERLVIVLDMLEEVRAHVRTDTRVQVRAGTSLIGDRVVYLSSGTARQQAVADGDTIRAEEQSDVEGLTSDAALAARELPGILENVKLLTAQLQAAEGTLGALGLDDDIGTERVRARAARIMDGLSGTGGTIGLALGSSSDLRGRAKRAIAQMDSIRALFGSNTHSVGRFRRDSTILREIAGLRTELAEVHRMSASRDGTIGRLRGDSTIARAIERDLAALDSLMTDIKKRPLRYIAF